MTAEILTSPAIVFLLGAVLLALLPQRMRASVFIAVPLLALAALWSMGDGYRVSVPFIGMELVPLFADKLSLVFGTIFAMIAAIGGIYAWHVSDLRQQAAALVYAGGALGVVLAADYFTLFVFWELMAVSSTVLVWSRDTDESRAAGMRYLVVHMFGGGLLFAGILMHASETGSFLMTALPESASLSSILILLGVALNTAIPPLHAWLADAYPKATITGAVFMSAFTTKSAVYVLVRLFPGWDILVWVGVVMALYGVVYAVLANDIREILAYHIVSQVGYMVAGVGIGTEMALNGTTAHAFSHILYKSLLFMGAGTVLYATGRSKLTELGGIVSKMKVAVFLYMIGAFSISGFPLFNGFISKSMVVAAAGEAQIQAAMLLLILASVGTFLHTGLKLPYFTWFGPKRDDIPVGPVPTNMLVAMAFGAFFCTLFGVWPDLLYRFLPFEVTYEPYTVYHLVEMIQILVFTFIGFWILRPKLAGEAKLPLDTDWVYRAPAGFVRRRVVGSVAALFDGTEKRVFDAAAVVSGWFRNPLTWLHPAYDGTGTASTYSPRHGMVMGMVLVVALLMGVFLL
jgi:multicomponent Na+:H+ antiporter subunit D